MTPTRLPYALLFALLVPLAAAGGSCNKSSQMGSLCTPGEQRCDTNAFQICADDGAHFVTQQDCSLQNQVCVQASGCLACSPNQRSCGGSDGFDIVRCSADGMQLSSIGRCDPENGDLCVGGDCQNACAFENSIKSYEGCEYYATDLDNAVVSNLGSAAAQQFAVVVSNPLELPATITVEVNDAPLGMPPQIRTVAQTHLSRVVGGGDLAVINLPPRELDCSSDPRLNDGSGTCLSNNAYHIRSTAPIVAYQFNPLENVGVFSNDASLLLPVISLGTKYMCMGWPQTIAVTNDANTNGTINLRAFLTIVGTEDNTGVTVTLPMGVKKVLGSAEIMPMTGGDTLQLTIGPYEVINLETDDFNADFTGTEVVADKNVAVFTGSEASDVPFFDSWLHRDCCADHLEDQLFPEVNLGTQYVGVKSPSRTKYVEAAGWQVAQIPNELEYWRILGTQEDTRVFTSLPPPSDNFFLGRGQFVTFSSDRSFTVQADKPVSFAQFPGSQDTTGIPSIASGMLGPPGGDPSIMVLPPVQQYRSKYVFLVPDKYTFDFVLMAVPTTSKILMDGEDLMTFFGDRCEFDPIGKLATGATTTTEYEAIVCPLSDPKLGTPGHSDPNDPIFQDDGRHTLESADGQPFGLVVWGWDRYVSYGYPGGANLQVINPQ